MLPGYSIKVRDQIRVVPKLFEPKKSQPRQGIVSTLNLHTMSFSRSSTRALRAATKAAAQPTAQNVAKRSITMLARTTPRLAAAPRATVSAGFSHPPVSSTGAALQSALLYAQTFSS